MNVHVNTKLYLLKDHCTVKGLLEIMGIVSRAAVWINEEQILMKDYLKREIVDGDDIKVVRIIGGG